MTPAPAYTPGPWMIPSGMARVISEGSWHTIAQCGPDGDANWTLRAPEAVAANARLIAAAPDLLEALRPFAFELHESYATVPDGSPFNSYFSTGDIRRARAAISKATGQ